MQENPRYDELLRDVCDFLTGRADACVAAGIDRERILLDPGFGFGKTLEHNLSLLKNLQELAGLGYPLLVGLSRKSLIAKMTGREVDERLAGSLALALLAVRNGASIVRVHDVAETTDVLQILRAYNAQAGE
ncbi:unnamed protein product [Ectocarpus sp. 12 AP-2014]